MLVARFSTSGSPGAGAVESLTVCSSSAWANPGFPVRIEAQGRPSASTVATTTMRRSARKALAGGGISARTEPAIRRALSSTPARA